MRHTKNYMPFRPAFGRISYPGFFLIAVLTVLTLSSCTKERKSAKAGRAMQAFVESISDYARSFDPAFIIIPQNGAELLYRNLAYEEGTDPLFLSAIDGMGAEELFYNGTYSPDAYRLKLLAGVAGEKTVLVSDYLNDSSYLTHALALCRDSSFLAFPRTPDNYYYNHIPTFIENENSRNIEKLSDAENYLYFIGAPYEKKEELIAALKGDNHDLVIIDLFVGGEALAAADLAQLKRKENGGRRLLIAYVSIGSAERYRYYWQAEWKRGHPAWLKKNYDGYPDEIWVDFEDPAWQSIVCGNDSSYLHRILEAGFDGAYLDNVEAYYSLYH